MQIWESPAWPNFRHDPSLTEGRLAAFAQDFRLRYTRGGTGERQ